MKLLLIGKIILTVVIVILIASWMGYNIVRSIGD
jgi:flagellar biosynthesis protein FliQ